MAVEVAREHPVEGVVRERKRQRVSLNELSVWRLLTGDLEHRFALVEADDLAAQVAGHEPRPAGDVERSGGQKVRDPLLEKLAFLVPVGGAILGEQALAEPPVVVLAGPRVVVDLHGS